MHSSADEPLKRSSGFPAPRPGQPAGWWPYALPWLVEMLGAPLLRRAQASWTLEKSGLEHLRGAALMGSWILACWHEALLVNMVTVRDTAMVAVVSPSWEGELIAAGMRGLGIRLARGSSGHQPLTAVRESVRRLDAGETIGWVVDGPSGPRRIVKPGIVQIAALSRRPIIPMHSVAADAWRLPSWDRQVIPKPFSRVLVGFGEPLYVSRELRGEALREQSELLNQALRRLETELVRRLGARDE